MNFNKFVFYEINIHFILFFFLLKNDNQADSKSMLSFPEVLFNKASSLRHWLSYTLSASYVHIFHIMFSIHKFIDSLRLPATRYQATPIQTKLKF